jgi:peptidoglycan/LPS O-acetylase OafA/YrhL
MITQNEQGDFQVSKIDNRKLVKLEAVRGFAAIYVALGHVFAHKFFFMNHDLSFFLRFGQEAVILFFLLSGFVIQYSYSFSKDNSFKLFFLKRFLRIYIPLLLVFAANYILYSLESEHLIIINKWELAGNLLMLQDTQWLKPNVVCGPFLGNSPLWSLSYEWWFYMFFFIFTKRVKVSASIYVYIISVLSAITYLFSPNFVNRELMYLAIWWIGADMAKFYVSNEAITLNSLRFQLSVLIIVILILGLNVRLNNNPLATIGMSPFLELRHFLFALVAIIGAVLWNRIHWVAFNKTIGLFEPIASISFGIYISHWFLVSEAHYLDSIIQNVYIKYVLYIIICLVFSYLIERVIYVPLNRWIMACIYPKRQSPHLVASVNE